MSAYVVVHLAPPRRARLTRGERPEGSPLAQHKVKKLLSEHGAELVGTPDRATASDETTSATIAVPDMGCAHKLAAALREVDGIETAYAKPGEELP